MLELFVFFNLFFRHALRFKFAVSRTEREQVSVGLCNFCRVRLINCRGFEFDDGISFVVLLDGRFYVHAHMKFGDVLSGHFGNVFIAERISFEGFDKRGDNLLLNFFNVLVGHAGRFHVFVFNDAVSVKLRVGENRFIGATHRRVLFRFGRGFIFLGVVLFFVAAAADQAQREQKRQRSKQNFPKHK